MKNAVKSQKSEYIEIPNPSDLKFRPIVVVPSCSTNRLSKLINILLQPFLNKIKSYITYKTNFLNRIAEKIYPNTLIVTFAVTNRNSNILHELGKQTTFWIDKCPDTLPPKFNEKFIIETAHFWSFE